MVVTEEVKKKYKPTIGIECHVQLKTKTKLFSAVSNDAREAKPNTLVSHIDTGLPGALPVLNKAAVELAARAAFALNTQPQKYSYFERKHYFYPDSPLGYQISQLHAPIIVGGSVEIEIDAQPKTIRINRAQLEADAGKNTHPEGTDYTLVDLNRAGTPLLEIVSEPDINSAAEAKIYARELYLLMKYADVSDVDLYHGNMRFDINVSVSSSDQLGIRSEVKNLNSFRSVENAVSFEIDRQIELLEKGQLVAQETRGWDDAKQKTISQRSKEEAHDYRYMPEPDIPPLELDDQFINDIKSRLPRLPGQVRETLNKLSISKNVIEDILDQDWICKAVTKQAETGDTNSTKRLGFWLLQSQADYELDISVDQVLKLSRMVDEAKLNSNAAQTVFNEMLKSSKDPEEIANSKNLIQVSDSAEVEKIVAEVISENQQAAEDVKKGEMKAVGFLVGQVMAKSQGKANPQLAQELIKKHLGL
jgi:aspartyl-tRNA(Asn)/glutamyl-tRNA(Gln) amidotransferase subunit B